MLYYKDLVEARHFYGEILGLPTAMENDWVSLFKVTSESFIGTVKEGGAGGFHQTQEINAVMISIATTEIAKWYAYLNGLDNIEFIKDLYAGKALEMQAFLIKDPGGYTVEFFQWNDSAE